MKSIGHVAGLGLAVIFLIGAMGCASHNVNPARPKAQTGYADFYVDVAVPLCWEVKRIDAQGRELKTLFSDFTPLPNNILRLALPPGSHRFRVSYLNRAIVTPAIAEATIREGQITPIQILYAPVETVSVKQGSETLKRSVRGVVRSSDFSTSTTVTFNLSAAVQEPIDYRPKEQTTYLK